jgi:putative phosphoesterase
MRTVGIISDTHGTLSFQAFQALAGSDLILHAGDIGGPEILTALGEIAPVVAIQGNMDFGPWADGLSRTEVVDFEGFSFYILHDLLKLDLDPALAEFNGVVFGHTHRPHLEEKDGIWYINPGSAGQRRYDGPLSVGLVRIDGSSFAPEIVELK